MNELIFILHIGLVVGSVLAAARLGKMALVAMVALQAIIANLFVLKQIDLFGLNVTCADVYIIGSLLAMNVLQEFWGRETARKAIWISLFGMIFFGAVSQFQLAYQPNIFDSAQSAYERLLAFQPRILGASLTAFFLTQQLDVILFGRLRRTGLPLAVRSGISLMTCQLFDTALFSFLGLYGLVNSIVDIMVVSFLIKVAIILCMTPLTSLARRPYEV